MRTVTVRSSQQCHLSGRDKIIKFTVSSVTIDECLTNLLQRCGKKKYDTNYKPVYNNFYAYT